MFPFIRGRSATHVGGAPLALLLFLGALLPRHAQATWPHDPNIGNVPVCSASGAQSGVRVCSDGGSGVILVWTDTRGGAGGDIYAQHMSATGDPLWTPNGVALCTATDDQAQPAVVSDGAGGAIVAWQDRRGGVSYDIYVQRVNAAGQPQWTANGVAISTATGLQVTPRLATGGAAGAIIAWTDYRAGGTNPDIYAQSVNAAGSPQWTANGLAVCTATGAQDQAQLVPDDLGGAIVTWIDPRSGTNYDIYAQRVNGGAAQWAANGVAICAAAGDQFLPSMVRDARGGAIISWQDPRAGTTNYDIYAQNVSASGVVLWTPNGVAVTTEVGQQVEPYMCEEGSGGAVITWSSQRVSTGYDVVVRRITAAGTPLWAANGLTLINAPLDQIARAIASDGQGGAMVVCEDLRGGVSSDVYAARVLGNGTNFWPSGGVAVCSANGAQNEPRILLHSGSAIDPAVGAIVAWRDGRNGTAYDIYAQRVDLWGLLGSAEPSIQSVRDLPNDQGGQVKLTWNASYIDLEGTLPYVQYRIWRAVPPQTLATQALVLQRGVTRDSRESAETGRLLLSTVAGNDYAWDLIESAQATGFSSYSTVVATTADSVAASNPSTVFMVELDRYGYNPTLHWYSTPDSGYSVDNLRPATPAPFSGSYNTGTTRLAWNPNREADLGGYRVYRGVTPGFVPGPETLHATLSDTGYVDHPGAPYVYKLVAVDIHGNESAPATFVPSGTVDAPTASIAELSFAPASPNPARGSTRLRFALPRATSVRLVAFDASGRRVRTLVDGDTNAGEHSVPFSLADDGGRALPSGLYLVRLEAEGRVLTRRVMAMR